MLHGKCFCTHIYLSLHKLPYLFLSQTEQLKQLFSLTSLHVYATFSGSLTIITNNGKEFKNELFQKAANKLDIKHQFSNPHLSQSNGILEKCHSFLKAYVRKHIHGKLDMEDTLKLLLFSFRMLADIHSKDSPFFFYFDKDPLTPSVQNQMPRR